MKNNTAAEITFSELKLLDNFLRDYSGDMNVIKAHGFLTALISLPDSYLPSDWLPLLVGDLKLLKPTMAQAVSNGLINIYHQAAASLQSNSEFKFLLSADLPDMHIKHASMSSIQEWCNGYCLALVWKDNEWLYTEKEYITNACATFFILADLISGGSKINQDKLIANLSEVVKSLYIYWLGSRKEYTLNTSSLLH